MIKLSDKLKTRSLFFTFTLFFLLFEKSIASVTDQDIQKFTEEILSIDDSGLSNLVTYDKQGKAETSQDSAKNPLLNVDRRAFKHPTVAALRALFDNYNPDVAYTEIIIKDEKLEESKFIDAVMETPVMQNTYNFLTQEGLFEGNQESFKQWWGELWFTKYSKGNGTTRSSAFKHVFLGEIKNNIVSGLHNWIFFNDQETRKTLKYMGWIRFLDFYKFLKGSEHKCALHLTHCIVQDRICTERVGQMETVGYPQRLADWL